MNHGDRFYVFMREYGCQLLDITFDGGIEFGAKGNHDLALEEAAVKVRKGKRYTIRCHQQVGIF